MLDTSKMLPVRGRHIILRKFFNTLQRYYKDNQVSVGYSGGFEYGGNGKYIINPKPYNSGYTYICKGDYGSKANQLYNDMIFCDEPFYTGDDGLKSELFPPYGGLKSTLAPITTGATDISGIKNLAGHLQYTTVADYMSANKFSTAAQIFRMPIEVASGNTYEPGDVFLANSATENIYNESSRFADWIIPTITWYAGDVTKSEVTGLRFFLITAYEESAYLGLRTSTGIIPPHYTYPTARKTYSKTQYHFMGIPYNGNGDKGTIKGYTAFGGGYITGQIKYKNANKNSKYYSLTAHSHDLPVTQLAFDVYAYATGFTPLATSYLGADCVTSYFHYPNSNSNALIRCAYKSVQDVIDIFADAGIFVSTDINEVFNPPSSDEGTINPDPIDELDYYPDNNTEHTPIITGYVTPATFAQNLIYTPLATNNFLKWVCNNTVDIANWRRLFANPADVILGINLYNLDLVSHDNDNVLASDTTSILGVSTDIANHFFRDGYNTIVDGGTCYIQAYYGNYADYTAMTYQCFVPFIGYISLRASDVVNKTLHLYYAVDFATGAANVFLNSDDKLIYTNTCNVASKIPLSTSDKNSQLLHNLMTTMSAGQAFANGFASGQSNFKNLQSALNAMTGLQLQTNYANRGSISALNSYSLLPAFVERTRFDLFLPSEGQQYVGADYQKYSGAPSTQFDTILNCVDDNGYVESDVVFITSATATAAEKEEIINLIKSGIYL